MRCEVRAAAAALLLAVAAAACSGDPDVEPVGTATPTETTAPTEDPEPPETEPDDPFAIPDEIDEPYVQAVMDELFAIASEALRMSVAANGQPSIPSEAQPLIAASHSGPRQAETVADLQDAVMAENVDEVYLPASEMGDERFDVLRLLEQSETCIVAVGEYDVSETARTSNNGVFSIVSLVRAGDQVDGAINPTPWTFHDGFELTADGEPATRAQVDGVTFSDIAELVEHACEPEA